MPKFYYVDTQSLHEVKFFPRVPMHRCKGEDDTVKRVTVALTINGALIAMPKTKHIDDIYYIHSCECDSYIIPTEEQVPDIMYTGEIWLTEPVQMSLESIIVITGISMITNVSDKGYKKYGKKAYIKPKALTHDTYTWRYIESLPKHRYDGTYHPDFITEKKVTIIPTVIIHYIPETTSRNKPNTAGAYQTSMMSPHPDGRTEYQEKCMLDEMTISQEVFVIDKRRKKSK